MLRRCSRVFQQVSLQFTKHDGTLLKQVQAHIGMSLLDVAHRNDIDIEGACGGQCACATCHVIIPKALYAKYPPVNEDENDMLDLAADVTATSRLGCQVKVSEDFEGVDIQLPKSVVSQLM